jgi:hypothetical protein
MREAIGHESAIGNLHDIDSLAVDIPATFDFGDQTIQISGIIDDFFFLRQNRIPTLPPLDIRRAFRDDRDKG